MIKSVTVTNYIGESIKLELRFPEKSGFLIQEISGLGPSKANINSTELSTTDGSVYNSSRLNSRNIVLTLKLMAKPTVEDIRQLSYKYFPIKKRLKLTIETDNRICETYGYVESNEPNIFSNLESTQISIVCPDPYFYSAGEDGNTVTILSGIESIFEFPFSNESYDENVINISEVITSRSQSIEYNGDSEIGISIYIHAIGTVNNLIIYNLTTRENMRIDNSRLVSLTGSGIIEGDDIFIRTVKGQKSITLLRNGIFTNIINCLGVNANWFQLSKGSNVFMFDAEEGRTNLYFRIENQTVYEGV
jgi:hypothetical protein